MSLFKLSIRSMEVWISSFLEANKLLDRATSVISSLGAPLGQQEFFHFPLKGLLVALDSSSGLILCHLQDTTLESAASQPVTFSLLFPIFSASPLSPLLLSFSASLPPSVSPLSSIHVLPEEGFPAIGKFTMNLMRPSKDKGKLVVKCSSYPVLFSQQQVRMGQRPIHLVMQKQQASVSAQSQAWLHAVSPGSMASALSRCCLLLMAQLPCCFCLAQVL